MSLRPVLAALFLVACSQPPPEKTTPVAAPPAPTEPPVETPSDPTVAPPEAASDPDASVAGPRALGIDVSEAHHEIDWETVHAPIAQGGGGKDFAFIRATAGGASQAAGKLDDTRFVQNIKAARLAGILAAPYHEGRIDLYDPTTPDGESNPDDEAVHFMDVAGPYMTGGYLRPVLTLRGPHRCTVKQLSDWLNRFAAAVVAGMGVKAKPMIYLDTAMANDDVDATITKFPLWLARPDAASDPSAGDPIPDPSFPNPYGMWDPKGKASPKPWAFWKYATSDAQPQSAVAGVPEPVDLDVAHGDIVYMHKFVIP